jgi:hypothetical protein
MKMITNFVFFTILFYFASLSAEQTDSDLDRLISPEIKNDAFYSAIYRLAKTESISTILEIGSSSGEGSTEAFVRGIIENPCHPSLFCIELSKSRFQALLKHYVNYPFIFCYNVSSVPLKTFPTEEEVLHFIKTTDTSLHQFSSEEVIRWLRQDIAYLRENNVPQNGIEMIKSEHAIEYFDMVLIDGSEFTGKPEFTLIYGAKFILLDDIRAFKNNQNYQTLLNDPNYSLLEEDASVRNGYAVFKRKDG